MIRKLRFTLICILLFFTINCENVDDDLEDDNRLMLEYGVYEGKYTAIFQYDTSGTYSETGDTKFTLSEKGYEITEDTYITPPYSAGTCVFDDSTIIFQDTTIHTDEFDWTLIINGEYEYVLIGDHFLMDQVQPQHKRKIVYDLAKQEKQITSNNFSR